MIATPTLITDDQTKSISTIYRHQFPIFDLPLSFYYSQTIPFHFKRALSIAASIVERC